MNRFRFLTSGESHGKCLNAIIEGIFIETFWLITLIIIGIFATKGILKRVSVQGG